jgi:tetratricopeptide (TPR) repeat protein
MLHVSQYCSAYNRAMLKLLSCAFVGALCCTVPGLAQVKTAAPAASSVEHAIALAESGHCAEALPLLKASLRRTADKDLQKRAGLDGLHCSMTHHAPYDSLGFLEMLSREFPNDPEVLYAATHAYSDLSMLSSQTLAREAPFSYQVHLLNAEALEMQGKWDEAASEYKKILEINPMLPGIHARLGRALLSKPPSPQVVADAQKNFEAELEIDPKNANAEYVLGELARNDNDFSTATRHYSRAVKLDAGFAEAYLGLGQSLVAAKQFQDAIPPLETYEKMAPESPSGHFQLALAYSGVGRKDEANREAALQRETADNLDKVRRRMEEGLTSQPQENSGTGGK